jgi:hypothetical protein
MRYLRLSIAELTEFTVRRGPAGLISLRAPHEAVQRLRRVVLVPPAWPAQPRQVQILFDIDRAAKAIKGLEPENPPREIQVAASGPATVACPHADEMRIEAAETLERAGTDVEEGV